MIVGDTIEHNANTGNSYTKARIFLEAGPHNLRAVYWEHAGGANFELYGDAENVPQTRLLGTVSAGIGSIDTDPDGLALVGRPGIVVAAPLVNVGATSASLMWDSEPGRTYRVSWSTDYVTWHGLPGLIPSQGATTSTVVEGLSEPFILFRIEGF